MLALGGAGIAAVLALWQVASALWIWGKPVLAAHLLEAAWQRAQAGEARARPWPWADTWPVARLRLAGQISAQGQIVLAGAGGEALAFAPAHVAGTAAPGAPGISLIAGHRDTVFSGLRELIVGGRIALDLPGGGRRDYVIVDRRVVHKDRAILRDRPGRSALVLVTCWPFDAIRPGGPLRMAFTAEPLATQSPHSRRDPAARGS